MSQQIAQTRETISNANDERSMPAIAEHLVDALNGIFGKQNVERAVHAKGIVVHGTFTPSAVAAVLSRAPHLQSQATPVTIRFSNFPGVATHADNDGHASPRGMAIKFHLPDGVETDLVAHSFNGFPTATADEFREFLLALAASGADTGAPTPLELFLQSHRAAKAFLEGQDPPPVSYATLKYFGVNSFAFTNADGRVSIGRYRIEPDAGVHFLSAGEASNAAPDYLTNELRDRVTAGQVLFSLRVQLAGEGDRVEDPSIAWPEDRPIVDLGRLQLTALIDDNDAAQRQLLFLPDALPEGIAPADPMIDTRAAAYHVSYRRRHQQ